jgi:hypothetical protein
MAKSDRIIKRGVRIDGKTFVEGQEDELGDVLPAEEADRLTEKGYLAGNWKGSGKGASKAEGTSKAEGPTPAKK